MRRLRAGGSKMRRFGGVAVILLATLAAGPEDIGSWVVDCGDSGCVLRHRDRLFDGGGVSADLEVRSVGSALVPVVVVRGLPNEVVLASSMAGKAEASVQFGGGARVALGCAVSDGGYVCAPREDAATALAARLVAARSVIVRVSVALQGTNSLTVGERSVELGKTREAVARLASLGASSAEPGGWVGLLDRGLKAFGYQNGTADLPGLLAYYFRH
jgi:hypothetical protein